MFPIATVADPATGCIVDNARPPGRSTLRRNARRHVACAVNRPHFISGCEVCAGGVVKIEGTFCDLVERRAVTENLVVVDPVIIGSRLPFELDARETHIVRPRFLYR